MRKTILILAFCLIGLYASAQGTLLQSYQIRVGTNDFTVMALPSTNLQTTLKWIDANWHTKAGYATTNQVNALTNTFESLSNNLVSALSSNLVANSNIVNAATSNIVSEGFIAVNSALQIIPGGSAELIYSCPTVIYTNGAGWSSSQYVIPSIGKYMFGFRFDYSHNAVTTAGDRLIVKLYKNGAELNTMHRHGLAYGGTETVISGEYPVSAAVNDVFTIRAVRDGAAAMTNAIGAATMWCFKIRN